MSAEPKPIPLRSVFFALLRRDLRVARRELPYFMLRTTMQPLLFVVVFGWLLPKMGFIRGDYGAALLPGILAVSLAFSAVQSVALPMVAEFGWTREIEDRLLAPVPTWLVAFEKVVSGVIQGFVAALFVLPVARLFMGPVEALTLVELEKVAAVILLGGAAFSALGLLLGTAINPEQIGLMFSVIVAPMLFFGAAYYPWSGLDAVPVLKWLVLINPLVYVSKGMRGALTPDLPHMSMAAVLGALAAMTGLFWTLGYRSFLKRAIG